MGPENTKNESVNSEIEKFLDFCKKFNLGYVDGGDKSILFNEERNADVAFELLKEQGFNVIKVEPSSHAQIPQPEEYIRIKLNI